MTARTPSRLYPVLAGAWLLAATGLSAAGQVARLRPPTPQFVLLGLTLALIIAFAGVPSFRLWLAGLNLRQIIVLHVTRLVGIYFLVLYRRGELPFAFAVPGGWGDILVATGALALVLLVPDLLRARPWVLAWNLLGLVDILFVIATASRLAKTDPASMQALLHLPLSLLPTFLVPVIIASHLYLFHRLRVEATRPAA